MGRPRTAFPAASRHRAEMRRVLPEVPLALLSIGLSSSSEPLFGGQAVGHREGRSLQVASQPDFWQIERGGDCSGTQTEVEACHDIPECPLTCTQTDCSFHPWADWGECHCTGIQERTRSVAVADTCGGNPCDDVLTETKSCIPECRSAQAATDCVLSDWGAWTACPASGLGQKTRSKTTTAAENGGQPCTGMTVETLPCAFPVKPTDCQVSAWNEWTSCSRTCDMGQQTRMRRILQHAANGGLACDNVLLELMHCNVQSCGKQVGCVLGDWEDWLGCDDRNPLQKEHQRSILTPAAYGGEGCTGPLFEYAACPHREVVETDCSLSEWTAWRQCDKSCGGGQQFRSRQVAAPPVNGGSCPHMNLRATQACNTQSCLNNTNLDCTFSNWGDWKGCSAECGVGQQFRSRAIASDVMIGGQGCLGALNEFQKCESVECVKMDCVWQDWHDWSACTCTCNGGSKTRNRHVLTAPRHRGKLCDAEDKTEIAPCNTQPCACNVVNGTWSAWTAWSTCSVSCGTGYSERKRMIETEASSCGWAPDGLSEEYQACKAPACLEDHDAKFSDWKEWGDCTCECYGYRQRTRNIASYRQGRGLPAEGPLVQYESCNPGVETLGNTTHFLTPPPNCPHILPPVDCKLGLWTPWSQCTQTCGGGQTQRKREVDTPASHGGKPCVGENGTALSMVETFQCETQPCVMDCTDCKWNLWSDWSECSTCGGEKRRTRNIKSHANYCGHPCQLDASVEVANCTADCNSEIVQCAWSQWDEWGECSVSCGSATQLRDRKLQVVDGSLPPADLFFTGPHGSECSGVQTEIKSCPLEVCPNLCEPQNCAFGDWSDWQLPSCDGLCARSRVPTAMNNECGMPCSGPVLETKDCRDMVHCFDPVDCSWADWSDWTVCENSLDQRVSTRLIKQYPKNNGTVCEGAAKKTEDCDSEKPPPIIDCGVSAWSPWGTCSKQCGGGTQERTRYVQTLADNGGTPCTHGLAEIRGCAQELCGVPGQNTDCALSPWSLWGSCDDSGQQYRKQAVLTPAKNAGLPCSGNLMETQPCLPAAVDCKMSEWSEWDACDKTCNGGQRHRHRQVHTRPKNRGSSCPGDILETEPCNELPCGTKTDCVLSEWSKWEQCPVTCGAGQQQRTRAVLTPATIDGIGCEGKTKETQGCASLPSCGQDLDCLWGQWEKWSACTASCLGGTHRRSRVITAHPTGSGKLCDPLSKDEIKPCNTQPCNVCVDGAFSTWSAWTTCSVSCDGGTKNRYRTITQDANFCGQPASGYLKEIVSCNDDTPCNPSVDCEFGAWSAFSACSASCDGVTQRHREIAKYGSADGAFCEGSTEEIVPCNPAYDEDAPAGCNAVEAIDCVLTDWTLWPQCPVSCGKSQYQRARHVLTQSTSGGRPCEGHLTEMAPCSAKDCVGDIPEDCYWDDWGPWSACTSLGQKERSRNFHDQKFGGAPCQEGAARETGACVVDSGDGGLTQYCSWADWQAWGPCSATCGNSGRQQRTRRLVKSDTPPKEQQLYERNVRESSELRSRAEDLERNRAHELAVAFSGGVIALMVVLLSGRVFAAIVRPPSQRGETFQRVPNVEDYGVE